MVPVAVITGGDLRRIVGGPQGNGLAMIGLHIVLQAILMAFATALITGGLEESSGLGFDLVRTVAVCADRSAGIPFRQELTVDALHVSGFHAHMAFATGVGDMGMVDRGVTIDAAADIVHPVTVIAGGGDNQSEFEQGSAMDAFHVLVGRLWELHFVFRRQVGVAVAARTGGRQV